MHLIESSVCNEHVLPTQITQAMTAEVTASSTVMHENQTDKTKETITSIDQLKELQRFKMVMWSSRKEQSRYKGKVSATDLKILETQLAQLPEQSDPLLKQELIHKLETVRHAFHIRLQQTLDMAAYMRG